MARLFSGDNMDSNAAATPMNNPLSQKLAADQKASVDLIREAFHYQSRFEGSTMVFKIDCPVMEDLRFPSLMKDMALLAQTGFRVVIVPGAKERIDAVLKEYGIVSNYLDNARITTTEAMPFVEMAAFHAATRFMTLSASRVDAVMGNFVRARGLGVINGTDMAHTGAVDKVLLDSSPRRDQAVHRVGQRRASRPAGKRRPCRPRASRPPPHHPQEC